MEKNIRRKDSHLKCGVIFISKGKERLSKRHQSVENFLSVKKERKRTDLRNSFFRLLPLPPKTGFKQTRKTPDDVIEAGLIMAFDKMISVGLDCLGLSYVV